MSLDVKSIPGEVSSWTSLLTPENAMPGWATYSSLCQQDGQTAEDLTSAFGRCKVLHKVTLWGDVASEVWI